MRTRLIPMLALRLALCPLESVRGANEPPKQSIAKIAEIFGATLKPDKTVYRINDSYVVWLIFDRQGTLFEVDVGPFSFYQSEFPSAPRPSRPENVPETEYQNVLSKISQIREIGNLVTQHQGTNSTDFGPLQTDRFEHAFVDRILTDGPNGELQRFKVYFLQNIGGSPEELKLGEGQPLLCLTGVWYYFDQKPGEKVELGKWRTFSAAGPNLYAGQPCSGNTTLYDENGFTIERPQNETVEFADPIRARNFEGTVTIADEPVEGATVEILVGQSVMRTKSDANGHFTISGVPDGEHRFKVTKDGFKALSGSVILSPGAPPDPIVFQVYVGT